jgi:Gpi18-like mannosyltransferase
MIASKPWYRTSAADKLTGVFWRDRAVRVSIIVFLALRLLTLFAAPLMIRDVPLEKPPLLWYDAKTGRGNPSGETYDASLPMTAPLAQLMVPWRRYDTAWYIHIAMVGYRADTSIVFPPLYPVLIHYVAPLVGGNYVLASVLISNIACLIAFILLYKLIYREFQDDGLATRTLILFAAFPTAYYLMAGYTETVFLAFTLGAFTAAYHKQWLPAGALAFLASTTRLQGIVLCLPLAWIAYIQLRESGIRAVLSRIPAVIGGALGTASVYAYIYLNHLGDFEKAFNVGWKLTTRMPWVSVHTYLDRLQAGIVPPHENNNAFILAMMMALGIIVTLKFKPQYALYVWASLFVIMLRYHYGQNLEGAQFESAFRYVLLLFPCFIAAAMVVKRRWMMAVLVAVMLQWQLYLMDNFIHWRWVA